MENMAKYYMHEIPEGYEARIEGNKVIIELRESEDERIRKEIINFLRSPFVNENITDEKVAPWLAWLEKQREPHYTKRNALFDKCVAECDPAVMKEVSDEIDEMLEKEQKPVYIEGYGDTATVYSDGSISCKQKQKPASTEDMPYITDEHFFEREPVDSFRYKLAEYMTKNYRKVEGPYGHTYAISAESILQMAKEELIRRGELKEQKPAEWSKEEKRKLNRIYEILGYAADDKGFLKSKRIIGDKEAIELQDFLRSIAKPKTEWSEEDEDMRLEAIRVLVSGCERYRKESGCLPGWHKVIDWLKSLRPVKQQWSEEDEKMLRTIISDGSRGVELDSKQISFLKSLRPLPKRDCKDCAMFLNGECTKPHWKPSEVCYGAKGDPDPAGVWKPSEEQMNALNALNCHGDLSYVGQQNQLISLQKDLEKLKGGVAPMREIDE